MRYKEFNVNRVLEKCLLLFWRNGFENSSIQQVVEATSVNRFSLYNEFDNKTGLLNATVNHYFKTRVQDRLDSLLKDGNPKEVILNFFDLYLNDNKEDVTGCYILHMASEMADKSEEIKSRLNEYLTTIERAFSNILKSEENKDFLARHLVGQFCTAMCFSVVLSESERKELVLNGVNIVLNKSKIYA